MQVVVILWNAEAVNSLDYFRRALQNKRAKIGWAYLKTKDGVFSLPCIFFPVREGQTPDMVREKTRRMLSRYPGAEYLFDTGEVVTGVSKNNRGTGKTN